MRRNGFKWMLLFLLSILTIQFAGDFLPSPFNFGVQTVEATTSNFYSTTDGYVRNYGTTYSTVHDASTGDLGGDTGLYAILGQIFSSPNYFVQRSYFRFNTSSIPDNAVIVSAKLRLYGETDESTTDFVIRIQKWTEAGDGLTTADYDGFDGVNYDDGQFSTSTFTTSGYNDVVFSNFALINKTGYTDLCIRSSRDISSTSPSGSEDVLVKTVESDYDPILVVEHSVPPTTDSCTLENPSIETQGCLAMKQSYTFRVKVSDPDGGADIDKVRFELWEGAILLEYRWVEATDTFSEFSDANDYAEITSTSEDSSLSGNQWTLDFKIKFHWNYPSESLRMVEILTYDDAGNYDDDNFNNMYYVEDDLTVSSASVDDNHINPSQTITFTGTLLYQGTTIPSGTSGVTAKVMLGGTVKGSTTTINSDGNFSVSFSGESTVGDYSYTVFATTDQNTVQNQTVNVTVAKATIGEFSTSSYTVYADSYFLLNATIKNTDGLTQFVNTTIEITNSVVLNWVNSTNTFSIENDPHNYCTLDASGSFRTQINSTAYRLSWKIKLSSPCPASPVSIVATNTKVFGTEGITGSNSCTGLFCFEGAEPSNVGFSSIVGSTTANEPTADSTKRKVLYASGLCWIWYSDGANLVYKTSTDGLVWSDATKIAPCTEGYRFSIFYNGTYVDYVRYDPYNLYYRRGAPNSNGIITWIAPEQTVYGTGNATNMYGQPNISIDSEGYPWIGVMGCVSSYPVLYPYVFKSSLHNGTWATQSGFPYQLSTINANYAPDWWRVTAVPLPEKKVYVLYAYGKAKIRGQLWNGTAWGAEETASASYIFHSTSYSAINEGNIVHLVFANNSTAKELIHVRRTEEGWQSEVLVTTNVNGYGLGLTIDESSNSLFCSWLGPGIYYKRYVNGKWDSFSTEYSVEADPIDADTITSSYKVYNNKLLLVWGTFLSPRKVKFNGLAVYYQRYLIETEPTVTLSDLKWESFGRELSFSATSTSTGTKTIKVNVGQDGKPYYVKISGIIYPEGMKWTYSNGVVEITVEFSSSRTIVLSWGGPPEISEGGQEQTPTSQEEQLGPIEQFVTRVIKPAVLQINTYWVGLMILGVVLLGTAYAKKEDEAFIFTMLAVVGVILFVNFLGVWILVPMNLLPPDLTWMTRYFWTPPALQLEMYGLPTEQTLYIQMLVIGVCTFLFIGAFYLMTREE